MYVCMNVYTTSNGMVAMYVCMYVCATSNGVVAMYVCMLIPPLQYPFVYIEVNYGIPGGEYLPRFLRST